MRRSNRPIRIASRDSDLARVQAERVAAALRRVHPSVPVEFEWLTSEGDRRTDRSLATIGGKGLFVRNVEAALIDRRADVAVHSLKDLPALGTPGLILAAIPPRGDVRDCFVCPRYGTIAELPPGSTIGTSSPRRVAQVRRIRDDIEFFPLRGNVPTRLRRVLEDGFCDAAILAAAGLQRLGRKHDAIHPVSPDELLPAPGQAAIAVQCRADDHLSISRCLPLNDPATSAAVNAERRIVAALEADCHSAVGVLAELVDVAAPRGGRFRLRAQVLDRQGKRSVEVDHEASGSQLRRLVQRVLTELEARGARELLGARV